MNHGDGVSGSFSSLNPVPYLLLDGLMGISYNKANGY